MDIIVSKTIILFTVVIAIVLLLYLQNGTGKQRSTNFVTLTFYSIKYS